VIDWLASYPKSGNTWMRMLLANYFSENDEPHDINSVGVTNGIASSRWRFDELLGMDSEHLYDDEIMLLQPRLFEELVALAPAPQWMKVHDAQLLTGAGEWLFPPGVSNAVVYLIRNPLDVAVSRAFHDGHENMNHAVKMLCAPGTVLAGMGKLQLRQIMGSWSDHVTSWVDQTEIPLIVVRYEDMLADTARELARVIGFARPDAVIDQARLDRAVAHASFENLREAEAAKGFREAAKGQARFFRSGKAGDWVNHLNAEHVARICEVQGPTMARFGYSTEA